MGVSDGNANVYNEIASTKVGNQHASVDISGATGDIEKIFYIWASHTNVSTNTATISGFYITE